MATSDTNPGYATAVDLARHWAVDRRSVPAIAQRLGLRRRASGYAWRLIWAAEGLAEPAAGAHDALRAPMMTPEEAAVLAGVSAKTLIRWSETGWDGCPGALRLGDRLRRYRRDEIAAWLNDAPDPHRKAAATGRRRPAAPSPAAVAQPAATPASASVAAPVAATAKPAPTRLFRPGARPGAPKNDIAAQTTGASGQPVGERTQ